MSDHVATGEGIGQPVLRKEDRRFIVGKGHYAADHDAPNMAYAAMVRTPHAHARIKSIDTSAAKKLPGVIAIFVGADFAVDGHKPIPHGANWEGPPDVTVRITPGTKVFVAPHLALPTDRVRFVGELVAIVVAETHDQAKDAAELIEVDYEILPAVARAADAVKPGSPVLWEQAPSNISLDCDVGDKAGADAAFAKAAHVVRLETWINRVTGVPMEPRTAIGEYDAAGRYTIWAGTGGGMVKERQTLAGSLGVPLEKCRAMCGDMGGNFGTRNTFFPEYAVLPWIAQRIHRPVKYMADRTECFLSDYQGRDLTVDAELALDKDGNFLAMRGTNLSNIGAYTAHFTPLRKGLGIMQGVYRIPFVHFRGAAVLTNTPPTTPYRSAGRPEAIYVIERLVDMAADQCGFDPIELRRRNFIQPDQFPYTNAVGITYDNGEYEKGMDEALKLADWKGFAARRAESKKRGMLRGFGIANYLEGAGGAPRERAEVTLDASRRRVELVLGTMNSGQGHETSFAQLLTTWLGVPFESVDFVAHDTDRVSAGGGSHSGRSMRIASLAIGLASDIIIEKGKKIAAHMFEASPADIEFASGVFSIKGTDRRADIFEVAKAAETRNDLSDDLRGKLDGIGDHTVSVGAFPSGTHICEVEIDPDTGVVKIVKWSGVDDVGLAVNPMILHGQTHGAAAQGIGQAMLENCHYDRETAQLLSASFMDYAMPRADYLPSFDCALIEVPATSHKYGIRPGGEGGTTPALGACINAVVDALSELGVTHIEMPATPERVWQAVHAARAAV